MYLRSTSRYAFVENLYKSGMMQDCEYRLINEWFNFLITYMDFHVDEIIYLRTTPEVVHERIKKRNRSEEQIISLKYLKGLNHYDQF